MLTKSPPSLASPSQDWLVRRVPFFYGWIMVPIAMLAFIATSPGQTFGVSLFNTSLRETLNINHSQLTGAYMLGTLLAATFQPYVGGLMDRFGIRRVITAVIILFGFACLLMSQVQNLITLFLAFFCLRMLGQGALSLLANNTLAMWFQLRLGRVAGFMNVGMAGATAVIPLLIVALIAQLGWRGTYIAFGITIWIVMLPLILIFYRNRPEDVGQQLDGLQQTDTHTTVEAHASTEQPTYSLKEAQQTPAYWILVAASAAWGMIATAIFFNIVPLFTSQGLTEANAATTYTTLAIATAISELTAGFLADRFPLNRLLVIGLAGLAIGVWMLTNLQSMWQGHLYAAFIGVGQGLFSIVNSTVWVRYYGRLHLGKIRGSVWTAVVAASSVGPFLLGFAYDRLGSYQSILWLFIFIVASLSIIALWAKPPST